MRSLEQFWLSRLLGVVFVPLFAGAAVMATTLLFVDEGSLLVAAAMGLGAALALAGVLIWRALVEFRRAILEPLAAVEESLSRLEQDREIGRGIIVFREIGELFNRTAQLANTLAQRRASLERQVRLLNDQARIDPVTTLGNTLALSEMIAEQKSGALVLIQFPTLDSINGFYGQRYGDVLLHQVGLFLKERVNRRAFRAGGDLVAVCFLQGDAMAQAQALLGEICALSVVCEGTPLSTETIGGVALLGGPDPLAQARLALKEAAFGSKPLVLFDDNNAFLHAHEQNRQWAQKLEAALSEDRIKPFFQPYVELQSGAVVGHEALVRLIDEKGVAVSPGFFLAAAQNSGLYPQLSERVITQAITTLADQKGWVCLNLTVRDILHLDLDHILKESCQKSGIAPERIYLELNWEKEIATQPAVVSFLQGVRREGMRLMIENFGGGGEDLSAILALRPDAVKFSGGLVRRMHESSEALLVIRTLLALIVEAGVVPIATFVSDAVSAQRVKELGFVYAQGGFYGDAKEEVT